jgi:hypothetical protein
MLVIRSLLDTYRGSLMLELTSPGTSIYPTSTSIDSQDMDVVLKFHTTIQQWGTMNDELVWWMRYILLA